MPAPHLPAFSRARAPRPTNRFNRMAIQTLVEPRLRRNIDRWLLLSVFLLMGISLTAIYAATMHLPTGVLTTVRQAAFFVVGLGLMAFVASRNYAEISRFHVVLYAGNLLLLLGVLLFAPSVKGANRWLPIPIPGMDFKLQPSEFAKFITIITLATFVHRIGKEIATPLGLAKSLAHIALPVVLIMAQKDLGTSLVLVAIWLGIVWLAGANWRHLVLLGGVGAILFTASWFTGILLPYQKARVITFLNPAADAKGSGYHILQSQIAIGAGESYGEGFGQGLQINGGFVPEPHTDFIFSVIGEEGGFVAACFLLATYGLFLARGLIAVLTCEDGLGRLIAGGVVSLFAFHVVINIGMTCGVLPVVGIPLPLVSMGGSAAWANLMAIGLLVSIYMRRHKILF